MKANYGLIFGRTDSKKMMKRRRSKIEESSIMTRSMVKRCTTKRIHDDDNSNMAKTLSDLPYHLLELIVRRLFFIEQINFRAVCKSFRFLDQIQPRRQVPWVMEFGNWNTRDSCMLKDLECKKTYTFVDINIKEKMLPFLPVHDSKCGWVLMSSPSDERTCYSFVLYAPLLVGRQNNIIELPLLKSEFRIATFSSDPSQEDCIFIAFSGNRHGVVGVSTCHRGDNAWRTQHFECDFPLHEVNHVVYFRGIFYCPNNLHGGTIGTYNVAEQNWAVLEPERSTLATYRDMFHVHRVKTDHYGGDLCLVLMDHPRGGRPFPFIPWSYFPGSIVPHYVLPYGLSRLAQGKFGNEPPLAF